MTQKLESTERAPNYYKEKYKGGKNGLDVWDEEFENEVNFLDPKKLKEQEDKIKSGEISCNMDDPEECLNCGS
tara:strand:+ start:195 stop:413 length:219 start_codon:yes stop_codon:yes gene_type:complete